MRYRTEYAFTSGNESLEKAACLCLETTHGRALSEKWGETPVAATVLHRVGTASEDELCEWISLRVAARYQCVARVIVMDDFPRNAAGKTLKRELRAILGAHWSKHLTGIAPRYRVLARISRNRINTSTTGDIS